MIDHQSLAHQISAAIAEADSKGAGLCAELLRGPITRLVGDHRRLSTDPARAETETCALVRKSRDHA